MKYINTQTFIKNLSKWFSGSSFFLFNELKTKFPKSSSWLLNSKHISKSLNWFLSDLLVLVTVYCNIYQHLATKHFVELHDFLMNISDKRYLPAKEIEGIATRIGHMPKFFESEFVRLCASIFAKNVLKVCWNKPVRKQGIFLEACVISDYLIALN